MNRIAEIMRIRGLSQGQLAKLAGVTQPYISKLIHGADPRVSKALRIAKALGVTVEDVWGGEDRE